MSKLSQIVDSLTEEMTKTAMANDDNNLSTTNTSTNISSNIGKSLLKIADALRKHDSDISLEEINKAVGK